jgi:hypothetical protein
MKTYSEESLATVENDDKPTTISASSFGEQFNHAHSLGVPQLTFLETGLEIESML